MSALASVERDGVLRLRRSTVGKLCLSATPHCCSWAEALPREHNQSIPRQESSWRQSHPKILAATEAGGFPQWLRHSRSSKLGCLTSLAFRLLRSDLAMAANGNTINLWLELRERFAQARTSGADGRRSFPESGVPTFRWRGNTTVWKVAFDVISSAECSRAICRRCGSGSTTGGLLRR